MVTNVYIDGFNLYYGCLRNTQHRWLDLMALCRVLMPKDEINLVRYFTAPVSARPDNPGQQRRQQVYLRALKTLPNLSIHYGHYLSHTVRMPLADKPKKGARTVKVIRTEEKGSDVNLATYLLLDAFRKECATAVVISNDSDLKLPIQVARTEFDIKVGVVNPHASKKRSRALQPTFFKQLRASALARCQLPETLSDDRGKIRKPNSW